MTTDDRDLGFFASTEAEVDPKQEKIIAVALKEFSSKSYGEIKLDTIAQGAGVPKRTLVKAFHGKKELYHATLAYALNVLQPTREDLAIDSNIPVEGMRTVVEAIFERYVDCPEAVRMIQMENLQQILDLPSLAPIIQQTQVILELDKLLMLGQDAGAFRPGISAYDLYYLMISMVSFRDTGRAITINIFDIDLTDEDNTAGMRRMLVDVVLGLLTSTIPDSTHDSYLTGFKEDAEPIYQS